MALKTAIGWRKSWAGTQYGKARAMVGLWGSLLSLSSGVVSGFFMRKAFVAWGFDPAVYFSLPT